MSTAVPSDAAISYSPLPLTCIDASYGRITSVVVAGHDLLCGTSRAVVLLFRVQFAFDSQLSTLAYQRLVEVAPHHVRRGVTGTAKASASASVSRIEPLGRSAVCVLCDGVVCAYARRSLAFLGNLSPTLPGDGAPSPIDCIAPLTDHQFLFALGKYVNASIPMFSLFFCCCCPH